MFYDLSHHLSEFYVLYVYMWFVVLQSLNQQLESQCSELTATVERLTNENIYLKTQHQQDLKVLRVHL